MESLLRAFYPIESNARHEDFIYPSTKGSFEIGIYADMIHRLSEDVFVPSLSLGFEYQGKQHFTSVGFGDTPLHVIMRRDKEKKEVLQKLGISLVAIPFWWNKSLQR